MHAAATPGPTWKFVFEVRRSPKRAREHGRWLCGFYAQAVPVRFKGVRGVPRGTLSVVRDSVRLSVKKKTEMVVQAKLYRQIVCKSGSKSPTRVYIKK